MLCISNQLTAEALLCSQKHLVKIRRKYKIHQIDCTTLVWHDCLRKPVAKATRCLGDWRDIGEADPSSESHVLLSLEQLFLQPHLGIRR